MEIILLGVQPESTDWGTALTPAVEAAQSGLIEAALEQIKRWTKEISSATTETVPVLAIP
jgi:hydrogenase maturation protease